MTDMFLSGGVVMWPLLLIGLAILFLAGRTGLRLRRASDPREADVEDGLRAILFWGGLSLVLGLLGTTMGIVQMAEAIERAGGVGASTVWSGVGVAMVTLIFGIVIFLVGALLWFTLRQWAERRSARHTMAG